MIKIEKILFPTDLTSYSLTGLEYAVSMSKLYNARLIILYVIDMEAYESIPAAIPEMNELQLSLEENGRIEMNRYIRENIKDNLNISQVVMFGCTDEVIAGYAESEKVDLIVMEETNLHSNLTASNASTIEMVLKKTNIPVIKINSRSAETNLQFQSLADKNYMLNTFGNSFLN